MNKRGIDEGDCDLADKWEKFRENAGQQLKERLNPPPPKKKLADSKAKHVNFITTRMVEFDDKKKKYVAMEDKQCVEMMCNLDFETVKERVWLYYSQKEGYQKSNYNLQLITGVNGPVVNNTLQLDNKNDIFVLFQQKTESSSSRSSHILSVSKELPVSIKGSNTPVSKFGPIPIRPSAFPKITPSIIRRAANVISKQCEGERCRAEFDLKQQGMVLEFDIKFVRGDAFAAASFRTAISIRITQFGDLHLRQEEYVLKLWNERTIEGRQEELPEALEKDIMKDLSKRSIQCQSVAQGLSEALVDSMTSEQKNLFGVALKYIPSYLVTLSDVVGTLEPKLNGPFVKYFNNTMDGVLTDSDCAFKSASLAHFSLEFTEGSTLLTDLQGVGAMLTDPEIASVDRYDSQDKHLNFGFENFGNEAITSFKETHTCNKFCRILNLNPMKSC